MSNIEVPDFMPQLRRGAGKNPKDGGCLVQIASWLGRGLWTDRAGECGVHENLRSMAITVNDSVDPARRRLLAPLAATIADTADLDIPALSAPEFAVLWARVQHANGLLLRSGMCPCPACWDGNERTQGQEADELVEAFTALVEAAVGSAGRGPAPAPEKVWRELDGLLGTSETPARSSAPPSFASWGAKTETSWTLTGWHEAGVAWSVPQKFVTGTTDMSWLAETLKLTTPKKLMTVGKQS